MSIEKKEWFGKKRLTVNFREDILFSYSQNIEDEVIMGFTDTGEKQDLDSIISVAGKSFKDLDPVIVFSFTNPKSIQNLIDTLKECKSLLEDS